jgi:hypothetical protein
VGGETNAAFVWDLEGVCVSFSLLVRWFPLMYRCCTLMLFHAGQSSYQTQAYYKRSCLLRSGCYWRCKCSCLAESVFFRLYCLTLHVALQDNHFFTCYSDGTIGGWDLNAGKQIRYTPLFSFACLQSLLPFANLHFFNIILELLWVTLMAWAAVT